MGLVFGTLLWEVSFVTQNIFCAIYVHVNISGQKIIQDTFSLGYKLFCLQVLIIYKRSLGWKL